MGGSSGGPAASEAISAVRVQRAVKGSFPRLRILALRASFLLNLLWSDLWPGWERKGGMELGGAVRCGSRIGKGGIWERRGEWVKGVSERLLA